ncbi:MAG: FtsQ-type POTRA domain-containing protein [Nocardioidaceae bacterium]
MSLFTRDRHDVDADEPDDVERTVRIARKRFVRRQWARRWLAWRRVVIALLLVVLVAGSVWLVFASSVLAVSGVRVEGTQVLDPRVVRRAAAVSTGAPLATVDLEAIGRRVERLPAVLRVDVSRSWPDAVRIDVTEREAVAVVARGASLRGLDATGVMFRGYPSRPRSLPLIRVNGRTRADALAEAASVAGSLPSAISGKVDFVEVRTVDTISLRLRNGDTVRWGSAADSDAKGRVLAVLLRQRASVYDVSVPGQPIIKK